MAKHPYSFTARSRAAMLAAIGDIANRRYYDHVAWPFCWNVKLPYVPDSNEAECLNPYSYDGTPFNPAWDDAWQGEMEGEWFDYNLIEDMRRSSVENYTTYDGDEPELTFGGRSGGWLILESLNGRKFRNLDLADLEDAEEWPFADLRRLYRALVVIDRDFAPDRVREAMLSAIAYQRGQWEESRREAESARNAAIAEEIQESRPDLAPQYD